MHKHHSRLYSALFRCLVLSSALFCGTTPQLIAQLSIPRAVLGSGAMNASSSQHSLRGTLSQTAIGRKSSTNLQHNVGYWYSIQGILDADRYSALVVLPNTHAAPGETLGIPLILQQSKNILQSGARTFKAVLRFNATLLEPSNKSGYTRTNDTGWVSVTGSISDSSQILTTTEFIAKLGNNENTLVEIESFVIVETASVRILKKPGLFSLDGVCREGGVIRLIKSVLPTTLQMFPNPAGDQARIQAFLTEDGLTDIYLIDQRGVNVLSFYGAEAKPGALDFAVDLTGTPSGSYFLMMKTPNEVFSQKVIIQK